MTSVLGISAFYHDSAAALLVDGEIVAAAQEERFTRKRHDAAFPFHAAAYCLREANIDAAALDYVGYYEKPLLKFERLLETHLSVAPLGFRAFATALPSWLRQKLHLRREIRQGLGGGYRKRIVFCQHHEAHAASAFYPSPFDEAAILTIDGVGEWATASFGVGRGNRVRLLSELRFPHSLGLLYSAFTYFAGFRVNSGEYKLMGLAPYGEPRFVETIFKHLIDLRQDGSIRLDQRYFNYCGGLTMTSRRFERLFGAPPRKPESPIRDLDRDLAASIQKVAEQVVLNMASHVHQQTGLSQLCMAGGVALNCVANGRLLREGPFSEIWIQPAAGDSGGALGAAQLIWNQLLCHPRVARRPDGQRGSLLGPCWTTNEVLDGLQQAGARYSRMQDEAALCSHVARLLAAGNVVGWSQGRMEFGPRALGNRSILGDPRRPEMQSVMNRKIKFRESFRPFAPAVLHERSGDCFSVPAGVESPYMLLTFDVTAASAGLDLPAATHVDGTARVQTVDAVRFPRFHRLLAAFEAETGCPALINTSFNVRGEPIVCTPQDAFRCFMATDLDALAIEDCVLLKSEQPTDAAVSAHAHLATFPLD